MTKLWVDQPELKKQLADFFMDNQHELTAFGSTVNQTFEAFVFASVVKWYSTRGWVTVFVHPPRQSSHDFVRLKFSTNGKPSSYTHVRCTKDELTVEVRHQIRVETAHALPGQFPSANLCIDVAVLTPADRSGYKSATPAPNGDLVTFAEAKHMSAFAELIAQFVGMAHEMMPTRLQATAPREPAHPSPFLFVSGVFLPTAQGVIKTIEQRGYDIAFHNYLTPLTGLPLPMIAPPPRTAAQQRYGSRRRK